jgi:hypothetical protein
MTSKYNYQPTSFNGLVLAELHTGPSRPISKLFTTIDGDIYVFVGFVRNLEFL